MTAIVAGDAPLILYIEDEADFREDITDELQDAGYRVVQAASGCEALGLLERIRPDLILSDITMPGLSGYSLLEQVRSRWPEFADIPFVFLTAQTDSHQVIEGKQAGVDDYLGKPVDFDLMLATIQARIAQVVRIRQHHVREIEAMQAALRELSGARPHDQFEPFARAFDYVHFGVVLLNPAGDVQFANRSARRIASASAIKVDNGFRLANSREMATFRAAFDAVLDPDSGPEDRVESLSVARGDGQRSLLCMVCGLGSKPNDDDAAVMLILSDPSRRQLVAPSVLESLFGFTPTEAQIANTFAEGLRTDQIATQFNISATTVAFHKRNLFDKTRTRRQADLIALLLSLPLYDES